MNVPTAARVLWIGTAASIPSGWSIDTDFYERYLQHVENAVTNPGTNGGVAAHAHGTYVHNHGTNHTHTPEINGPSSGTFYSTWGTDTLVANPGHEHEVGAAMYTEIDLDNETAVLDALAAHPPYITVFVIKPDDGNQEFPSDDVDGAPICFVDEESNITDDFQVCDGIGGTEDMDDLFVVAEDSAAASSGVTGGSETHHHNIPAHDHDNFWHDHGGEASFPTSLDNKYIKVAPFGRIAGPYIHHKAVDVEDKLLTVEDAPAMDTDDKSSIPSCKYIMPVQNVSGGSVGVPHGAILLWVGTLASIPDNWELMDGTVHTMNMLDKQIRCTTSAAKIGHSMGVIEHTHSGPAHNHTVDNGNPHTHTYTLTYLNTAYTLKGGIPSQTNVILHSHTSHELTEDVVTVTASSLFYHYVTDMRLPYREIALIKYVDPNHERVEIQGAEILGGNFAQ